MDKRIFIEKKADFQIKTESLVKELTHNLQLSTLKTLRIIQVYDVFGLTAAEFPRAEKHIFSEQVTDCILSEEIISTELTNAAFLQLRVCQDSLIKEQHLLKKLYYC